MDTSPEPSDRRRRVPAATSDFPRGRQLVAELKRIADRHPLTEADVNHIVAHAATWRRAILGEPGPTPTEDADAADAPSGPTGRAS